MSAKSRVIETLSLSKGGFAQPAVVLILLGIFAAAFFNFKNITKWVASLAPPPPVYQNTIPQWQVYKNQTHEFSIEYPNGWFVRSYGDYAANFQTTDLKLGEATPGAIRVKFAALKENVDQAEFEKIYKIGVGVDIYEPLDVKSIIAKVKNLMFGQYRGVEYVVNRSFSALEGPRGQFTHFYSVNKNGVILQFFSAADTKDAHQKSDAIFRKMIATLRF
ncbi:MAG: hypothetical protein Q7S45_03695 [Candidatus Curtissbacteria bacterium]|nr:hypothetical protein [Candidatus Curtissbacteria bacterium]